MFLTLKEAIEVTRPDVVIDFTRPDVAEANLRCALSMGVNCVLGTTGLSEERLQEIYDESATGDAALFHAPNFTTGAVLMMLFAQTARPSISPISRSSSFIMTARRMPLRVLPSARRGSSPRHATARATRLARRRSSTASRALAVPSSMACRRMRCVRRATSRTRRSSLAAWARRSPYAMTHDRPRTPTCRAYSWQRVPSSICRA